MRRASSTVTAALIQHPVRRLTEGQTIEAEDTYEARPRVSLVPDLITSDDAV